MRLSEFIKESLLNEGGQSGHLKHIIDYSELTFDQIKGILYSLFNGKIQDITEKIDGTNIQASMNDNDEVVFVRNKGDLNSERGGMSVQDMVTKWSGNPKVQQTFVESGKILEELFKKIGKRFFNPDSNTRIFANCECMIEGTTNIMPYISSKVNVHDLWVYEKTPSGWELKETTKNGLKKLQDAMEGMDNVQITPNVIVDVTEKGQDALKKYMKDINDIYRASGLKTSSTIEEYKEVKFAEYMDKNESWWESNPEGKHILFERFINQDKSVNIRDIKKMYPDNADDITRIDKNDYKAIYKFVMNDLDTLFLKIGNTIIDMCYGFINSGGEAKVIAELEKNLEDVTAEIEANGSEKAKTKLAQQLARLAQLDKLNATEGIVFRYKGRIMKCTGAFAPLNQALGTRFEK